MAATIPATAAENGLWILEHSDSAGNQVRTYAATLHEMEMPRPMMLDPETMESWRKIRAEPR